MRDLLGKIARGRFLVIGDLMLDHYLWGDATRISPEAPVPVVKAERDTFTAGGAANVAHNLRALGASVELVGTFGREGRYVLDTGQGLALTADSANQVTVGTGDAIMDGRHVCAETSIFVVGDAKKVGTIGTAVNEAFRAALHI